MGRHRQYRPGVVLVTTGIKKGSVHCLPESFNQIKAAPRGNQKVNTSEHAIIQRISFPLCFFLFDERSRNLVRQKTGP